MKFYFDCGLPRSGSTLLTALLNQNPNIHAGTLSPVFELMYYTDEILHKEQAKAFPKPKVFQEIVTNTLINYYSDVNNPVVIDKCRAWPAHIDLLKKYVTNNPKLICTVRHPLDILASFITLFHKDGTYNFIDRAMTEQKIPITDDNRCHYMMNPGGIVWESMNALATAFRQKQQHYIHFIQYDDLVSNPTKVMNHLHAFLELDPFVYNFDNINQKDREKDMEVYGLPTMHEVRKSINKISKPYQEVLSTDVINKYINYDFWNQQ